MFRSSTTLRELVQILAKVTLLLKHSIQLFRYTRISCRDVAACRETACVPSVVQTAVCTTEGTARNVQSAVHWVVLFRLQTKTQTGEVISVALRWMPDERSITWYILPLLCRD